MSGAAGDSSDDAFRGAPRAALRQPAYVKLPDKLDPQPVTILDLSESGARIDFGKTKLPSAREYDLVWFPVAGLAPQTVRVRCIWKEGQRCGIRFVGVTDKIRHILRGFIRFHRPSTS